MEEEVVAFRLGLEVWESEEAAPALRRAANRPYYVSPGEPSSHSLQATSRGSENPSHSVVTLHSFSVPHHTCPLSKWHGAVRRAQGRPRAGYCELQAGLDTVSYRAGRGILPCCVMGNTKGCPTSFYTRCPATTDTTGPDYLCPTASFSPRALCCPHFSHLQG